MKRAALLLLWLVVAVNGKAKDNQSLARKFNKGVEEIYQKAETLQDRALKRVYELQERAEEVQAKALKRAEQLERQAEHLMDRATRQAQDLQREAATQLGELQATIESLPIPVKEGEPGKQEAIAVTPPPPPPKAVEVRESLPIVEKASPKSKWENVRERTLPAVLMLGGLAAYIRFGGSMIPLIFLIQFGLFAETTSVADIQGWPKWWWFATAVMGTNGQFLSHVKYADVIAYGMAVTGLVAWVIQQNAAGTVEAFRSNIATLSATNLSLLILVGQSSFWIATEQDYGLTWILYPAFLVMINDTMAYVFGMLMGKHALLPVISPKKTWEGFVGATLSTLAVSLPLLQFMTDDTTNTLQHALAVATFVSLVSPFGGFLASVVKRAHGKKDFATYIPGHGGVVDRLDCQVMTAPFVYFYLTHFLNKT